MIRTRAPWLVVGALFGVAGAVFANRFFHRPESTPALRGEALARKLGCFACHGGEGRGGIVDPGARGGGVPGWDGPTVATYAVDEQEVREWIMDGRPARLADVDTSVGRTPLVPMPAYRGRISERELSDLMAYFRTVSAFGMDIPEPAYEGRKIAARLGCFGCHGPSGIGGHANPGSFKGHIPAWDGDEFPELVRNDAEFREWILEGRAQRLWNNPLARHFLERQVIQMPAYHRHLSDDEVARLAAYVDWLRKGGSGQHGQDEAHKIIGAIAWPGGKQ